MWLSVNNKLIWNSEIRRITWPSPPTVIQLFEIEARILFISFSQDFFEIVCYIKWHFYLRSRKYICMIVKKLSAAWVSTIAKLNIKTVSESEICVGG